MNYLAPMKPISLKGPFAVLDVGSFQLGCLIVEPAGNNLTILSYAMHVSDGIQRGEITDLSAFAETLGKVVEAAERKAGMTVKDLHIVMPGGSVESQIDRHSLELTDPIVSKRDIRRLLAKQMQKPMPENRSLIASERLHYMLDGQPNIQNPKGMRAHHLALEATSISIASTAYMNVSEAVVHNHLTMGRVGNAAYASGLSCLSQEERDLGALVLDMGGGTTSAALFLNGGIIGITNVGVGGIHITRDIARILSIPMIDAERLKARDGAITPSNVDRLSDAILSPPPFLATGDNFIPASGAFDMQDLALPNGEMISRQLLSDIIRPRIEEILDLTMAGLKKAGLENFIGQRVVLTGGASQLTGIADFTSHYWKRHASLARPANIMGLDEQTQNPSFSALVGMAIHISRNADDELFEFNPAAVTRNPLGRLGSWLRTHL